MKIAMATSFRLDEVSGTPIHARAIARSLVNRGHEVFVITTENRKTPWIIQERLDNFKIYRIPLWLNLAISLYLLAREKPAVISAQAQGALAGITLPAVLLGIPLVYEVHGLFRDEMEFSYEGRTWRYYVYDAAERLALPRVQKCIVLSEKVREFYLQELGLKGEDVQTFYPAVPFSQFQQRKDLGGVRALRAQCEGNLVVMYAGSLYPAQGVDLLVESIPSVLREVPNVKFVIIGDEPQTWYQKLLRKTAPFKNQIIFISYQPHEDIPSYLDVADVLVIPRPDLKLNRVSPRKMCEYMAMGKAIVATDVADFKKIFADLDCGVVTDCNALSLAQGLIRVLRDNKLRRRLGANARRAARERFDFPEIIGSYLSVYHAAIRKKIRGPALASS
jgi:glycosyltransferase involved in cell wall biosynthesis